MNGHVGRGFDEDKLCSTKGGAQDRRWCTTPKMVQKAGNSTKSRLGHDSVVIGHSFVVWSKLVRELIKVD